MDLIERKAKVYWGGQDFAIDTDSDLYNTFEQASTQMRDGIVSLQSRATLSTLPALFRDGLGIEIGGEGVFRIFAYTVDYADNIGKYELLYKIDKTAPKLIW